MWCLAAGTAIISCDATRYFIPTSPDLCQQASRPPRLQYLMSDAEIPLRSILFEVALCRGVPFQTICRLCESHAHDTSYLFYMLGPCLLMLDVAYDVILDSDLIDDALCIWHLDLYSHTHTRLFASAERLTSRSLT